MECPICYENNARCQFVCGHTFCHGCTKSLYMSTSNTPTCPMCRIPFCFPGIRKRKKEWDREKREVVYTNLIDEIVHELMDVYGDLVLLCIAFVQKRYTFMMRTYPRVSCDDLDFILRTVWIHLKQPGFGVHEVSTYTRYLMVSKTEYGVRTKKNVCTC